MLQKIGDKLKSQRWLGIIILGLLAVIFALWGAYGIVDLTFGTPSYAAKVNGEEIPGTTVQNAWAQQQSALQAQLQGDIPVAQRRQLQKSLMDGYINETLLRQRAVDGGMRASDDQVRAAYERETAFQVNGKFDKTAAAGVLAQNGSTLAGYDDVLRRQLQTEQLIRGIEASDFLTGRETARYFALENEQRELRYALLPVARYEAGARIDDATLAAWLQTHAEDFQSPESVRLQYAVLGVDDLVNTVTVDEKALADWFQKNQATYQEAEKRNARHVLIQLAKGADAAAEAAARKKADEVLAAARSGKDFAKLAEQYSDDPGSKRKGGELGWNRKGAMVPEFDEALFKLQPGQISDVVKTQFGFHIIKLDGIQAATGKNLGNARAELERAYRRDLAAEAFGNVQEKLQQRMESSGDSDLGAVVKDLNMHMGEIPAYTRSGVAPLGSSMELNNLVFGATAIENGRLGGPVPLGSDRMVVVKLLGRQAAAPLPLAAVRNEVIAAVRKDAGTKAAMSAAEAAVKSLAGGADFNSVLRGLGVTATPATWVARGDPQLPVQIRDAAFALQPTTGKNAYQALSMEAGGAAVVAVSAVRAGVAGANQANDQQQISQYIKTQREAEIAAYQQELRVRATVKTNDALFAN